MDKKDHQILEILAQNCRIPHNAIAKALNLSKDSISNRIKKLEESKILEQYVLFIDSRKLGFMRSHLLMSFNDSSKTNEHIEKIKEHKSVMWINSFIGRYDIQVIVDATDGFDLDRVRQDLFEICDNGVKDYTILNHISDFEFTQINPDINLGTKFEKKNDFSFGTQLTNAKFPVQREFKIVKINKIELEILRILSDNPRESLIDISKKLKIDRATVKKRITNLIEQGVIINFGGIPNLVEMGFITYYMLVRVQQGTTHEQLKGAFKKLRNIFYAGKMVGDYDMILYLNAKNPTELNESINVFKSEIEEHIVHYDLLVQNKVHYWKQFHDGIYEELKSKLS